MSNESILETALAELERPAVAGRNLEAATETARLAALISEIDKTILARELVIENEDGKLVSCDISNRRLFRLTEVAFEYLDDPGMMNTSISEGDDEAIDGLREIFDKLVAPGSKLTVRSEAMTSQPNSGEIGLSANALLERWELDLERSEEDAEESTTDETVACTFAKDIAGSGASSIVLKDDAIIAQHGDDTQIAQLFEHAKLHLAQLRADLGAGSIDGDITMFSGESSEGDSLIIAVHSGEVILARVESTQAAGAIETWKKIRTS